MPPPNLLEEKLREEARKERNREINRNSYRNKSPEQKKLVSEKNKRRYYANREKILEKQRLNPKTKIYRKRWKEVHAVKVRENKRQYYIAHKEELDAKNKARRRERALISQALKELGILELIRQQLDNGDLDHARNIVNDAPTVSIPLFDTIQSRSEGQDKKRVHRTP